MDKIVSGIYQIRNIINGHVYIGSSANIEKRWRHHINNLYAGNHHSCHLQSSWNKYGQECFVFEVIEQCPPDRKTLIEREQFYLDTLVPEYNILRKADSPLGLKRTDEVREKISLSLMGNTHTLGHKLSDEHKIKLAIAATGKVPSQETRLKISKFHKGHKYNIGRKASEEKKAKMSKRMIGNKYGLGRILTQEEKDNLYKVHKGRIKSDEERRHISEALTGRSLSSEHRAKISAGNMGRTQSPETRAKISATKKKAKLDAQGGGDTGTETTV